MYQYMDYAMLLSVQDIGKYICHVYEYQEMIKLKSL